MAAAVGAGGLERLGRGVHGAAGALSLLKLKMVFNFEKDSNARSDGLSTGSSAPMTALKPGQRARIQGVELAGPVGTRLRDLGFLPGTEVRMIRRAPLGDPAVYEIRGAQICLRRSEARAIRVVPLPS